MRILVTGAGGFIGSRLAVDLAGDGHGVTASWRHDRKRFSNAPPDRLTLTQLDIADSAAVRRLFETGGYDAVVHCAARLQASDKDSAFADFVADNVLAQGNLLDAAGDTGCRRFVFCSTISVYGNRGAPPGGYHETDAAPNSAYGWSKRAGEEMLDLAATADNGLHAVSLRLAGVHGIGRDSGALAMMTRAALAGETISVAEPESRFRWLFIDDLVDAVRAALGESLPVGHAILNLASEDVFTLGELAEQARSLTGSKSAIENGPGGSPRNEVMNIERARILLGYAPQSLDTFLPRYIDALRHPE